VSAKELTISTQSAHKKKLCQCHFMYTLPTHRYTWLLIRCPTANTWH